jgi:hypothetical protein
MSNTTIRALFEDGPHAGEVTTLDPGPDGRPPHEVVLDDPTGAGGRAEESFDVEPTPTAATTYHLRGRDEDQEMYRYRAGRRRS